MTQLVDEILESCGAFLSRYRALICDVWGTLHDGIKAYDESNETLARYRESGGCVVLLSNSSQLASEIAALLDRRGVWRSTYDRIVTSGELTRAELAARNFTKIYHIGPERHASLFAGGPYRRVPLDEAQVIVCTGFFNDANESPDVYAPQLEAALARSLPFICANPDLLVDIGGTLCPCAGAIAALYEKMGGRVHWAGKPHVSAFRAALQAIAEIRKEALASSDVLAIGDALRTDIAGAAASGLDALFLAQGLHREEVAPDGRIDPVKLQALLQKYQLRVRAAAFSLK